MRTLAMLIVSLFSTSIAAAPPKLTVDTNAASIVVYRVVGATEATTDGSVSTTGAGGVGVILGYGAMDKMCADEFGPGARAATTEEAGQRDVDISSGSGVWVVPTGSIRGVASGSEWTPIDAANYYVGFESIGEPGSITSAACFKFRSNSEQEGGPSLNGSVTNCSAEARVLCSMPTVVPVSG